MPLILTPTLLRKILGVLNVTVGSNITQTNMRALADAAGYDEVFHNTVVITIASAISISSTTRSTPALATGTFPGSLALLKLVNNGFVSGHGGTGGSGGPNPTSGNSGGTAFSASRAVTIDNQGTVQGGGGGGGGGGQGGHTVEKDCVSDPGGSGGKGESFGQAAVGGGAPNGGSGGAFGVAGSAGGSGTGCSQEAGSGGSASGNYATGNSNITWSTNGTRLGGVS